MRLDESATCPHCQAVRKAEQRAHAARAGSDKLSWYYFTDSREWRAVAWGLAIALIATLIALGIAFAGARPANGWRYSDRAYKNDARTPLPIGNSQAILRRLLLEVGHSGAGRMQTVIALDGPRENQGKLLFWIARGDTLWHASVPPEQCLDGECSFLGVVDGEAPDSTTIVFVDWSTLTLANDGKGKRK